MTKNDMLLQMVQNFETQLKYAQEQLNYMRALIATFDPVVVPAYASPAVPTEPAKYLYRGYADVDKINLIKAVREISGMGLRESKEWVENTHRYIDFKKDFSTKYFHPAEINTALEVLRNAGAEITVSYPS